MADETTCGPLRWVRGDMHNHCEDHALVAEHLAGAGDALDFIVLTNHAQKPVFFEQHRMIEQAEAVEKAELIGRWQPDAAPAVLECLGP